MITEIGVYHTLGLDKFDCAIVYSLRGRRKFPCKYWKNFIVCDAG